MASQSSQGYNERKREEIKHYVPPGEEAPKLKRQRSKAMSLVFEEAGPKDPPKERFKASKSPAAVDKPHTPLLDSTLKAGKSSFLVRVGESSNLYKSAKSLNKYHTKNSIIIDLHGLTKVQALAKLEKSLPGWMDIAMEQSYPFVIQVKIVCGGGSQILAETIETWIKEKKNVENAPKNHI